MTMTIAMLPILGHWWWVRNELTNHTTSHHTTASACASCTGCEAFSAFSIPLLRIISFNIHIYNCVISQFYTQKHFRPLWFLELPAKLTTTATAAACECCSRLYVGFCYSLMSPFSLLSLFIAWETIGHFELRIIFAKSVSFAFISLCSEALFYLSECFSGCFFSLTLILRLTLTLHSFFKFHYSANAMLLQTVIEGGNVGSEAMSNGDNVEMGNEGTTNGGRERKPASESMYRTCEKVILDSLRIALWSLINIYVCMRYTNNIKRFYFRNDDDEFFSIFTPVSNLSHFSWLRRRRQQSCSFFISFRKKSACVLGVRVWGR